MFLSDITIFIISITASRFGVACLFFEILLILRSPLLRFKVRFDRWVEARCKRVDLLLCNLPHTFSCTGRCTSAGVTVTIYQDIFHLPCSDLSRRKLSIIRTAVNSALVSPRYVVIKMILSAPNIFLWRYWFPFFFSLIFGFFAPSLLIHKVTGIVPLADLSIGRLYVSVHRFIRQQTLLVPFEL